MGNTFGSNGLAIGSSRQRRMGERRLQVSRSDEAWSGARFAAPGDLPDFKPQGRCQVFDLISKLLHLCQIDDAATASGRDAMLEGKISRCLVAEDIQHRRVVCDVVSKRGELSGALQ